ncbi:hypothetical protein DFA_06339 [Cavenderia fasciculata]|uniref:Uncharacterized protein n=1 Tax=Cavenderia fasciculata TaxID=261658 RepID=F4PKR8_CACFS|nr:uncharacterized protein DFA_06339 [Cavenderia fasciculata]EGG24192.1 hypothetical protein DFA_06339 [Cavenderia fasciculata]|eukprot:XP_004362043.1 hypothetical protein DFA_06339 [Cavenderia fasciculata]
MPNLQIFHATLTPTDRYTLNDTNISKLVCYHPDMAPLFAGSIPSTTKTIKIRDFYFTIDETINGLEVETLIIQRPNQITDEKINAFARHGYQYRGAIFKQLPDTRSSTRQYTFTKSKTGDPQITIELPKIELA